MIHDDSLCQIMVIHDYESPCGPARIPFRATMALVFMGVMNNCNTSIHGAHAFFQAETLNIGIVAVQLSSSFTRKYELYVSFT